MRKVVSAAMVALALAVVSLVSATVESTPAGAAARACDWPMWGYSPTRLFATRCHTEISPDTVDQLRLRWFFNTRDVVTASPAVVGDTAYVGDWSGRVYAIWYLVGFGILCFCEFSYRLL
jgi:hypothetical protein